MGKTKKLKTENERQYIYRIITMFKNGEIDGTWETITQTINDNLRRTSKPDTYRKQFEIAQAYNEDVFSKWSNESEIIDEQWFKVKQERLKLSTDKLEFNRWLREHTREEMFFEKVVEAIQSLPPMEIPEYEGIEDSATEIEYALMLADQHYGCEFTLRGIFNEVIASYSPEIFEERMEKLLNEVVFLIKKEGITKLKILSLGDELDGMLRVSQLWKLRYGVVDAGVKLGEYMANWLNELTRYVHVEFHPTSGNHTELRELGQPKGTFKNDNMSKVINAIIQTRLINNERFEFFENPTGMIHTTIGGYTVVGIHGETRNMEKTLLKLCKTYKVNIDYLVAGHLHHNKNEEIGFDSEVINVGSIIGVDDYSLSIEKTSNASAKLIGFRPNKGKYVDYTIKLN